MPKGTFILGGHKRLRGVKMDQKKFIKIYAIGIISIVIIISLAPSNINAIDYTEVQFFKWDGTRIIEEITNVSTSTWNTFQDDFDSCETAEEGYAVFQDYGLAPQDKTYDDFIEWAENEYENNQEMQEYVENHSVSQDDLYFSGLGVIDGGSINAPFYCEKNIFANYYIYVCTDYGATVTYSIIYPPDSNRWEGDGFFEEMHLFYLGSYVPPAHNGWNVLDRTFAMIAMYAEATMEITE